MSYPTVMVSLTVDQSNEAVLEVAGQVAEKFDAEVIGVTAAVLREPPYFMAGPYFTKDFVDQGEASIRKRLSEIEEQFRAGMNGRAKNVEWRCSSNFPHATSPATRAPPTSSSPQSRAMRSSIRSRWPAPTTW